MTAKKEKEAERIFLQAMRLAEQNEGPNSPLVGTVMLELLDLYDNQHREEESDRVWKRIRRILVFGARFGGWYRES